MEKELVIRNANLKDLDSIINIFNSAIKHMNDNNLLQWDEVYPNKELLEEDILNEEMFVGVIGNEIVSAFVINQDYEEEYNDANWYYKDTNFVVLHRFCVNTAYQNQGIGKKTLKKLEELMIDMKVETIRLDAFSLNPQAIHLYEKAGYKKRGEANWRKGLFYLYEKKLK